MKDGDDDNPPKKNGRYKNHACSRILVGGEDHNVNKGAEGNGNGENLTHTNLHTTATAAASYTALQLLLTCSYARRNRQQSSYKHPIYVRDFVIL